MKHARFKVAAGMTAAAMLAVAVPAEDYTWSGLGGDGLWSHFCNWDPDPKCPSEQTPPDDCGDTAYFPWNASGPWDCIIISATIAELTIAGSVDFDGADPPQDPLRLTTALLKISPTAGDIEITMSAGGEIEVPLADPCP